MRSHLPVLVLLCVPAAALAQYPYYPPVVYGPCPPVYRLPCPPVTPPGCAPTVGNIAPDKAPPADPPKVLPERDKAEPKKDEPKKQVNSEVLPMPTKMATPTAIDTPEVKPTGGSTEKLPPINVPAQPPEKLPEFKPLPESKPKEEALPPLPKLGNLPESKPDTLPKMDLPKLDGTKAGDLPKFDPLPPLPKLNDGYAQPVEAKKTSISKASPIGEQPTWIVDVYPVDGPAPKSPGEKRSVGFYNKSNRDLLLTVNEESVILPSQHFLKATLPANSKWQIGTGEVRDLTVPTAAPGADVVIR